MKKHIMTVVAFFLCLGLLLGLRYVFLKQADISALASVSKQEWQPYGYEKGQLKLESKDVIFYPAPSSYSDNVTKVSLPLQHLKISLPMSSFMKLQWYQALDQKLTQSILSMDANTYLYVQREHATLQAALDKGYYFVSNGPLLHVQISERSFGESLSIFELGPITYHLKHEAPLTHLNVIADGQIIHRVPLNHQVEARGELILNLTQVDWLVFELVGVNESYAISNPIYIK